CEQLDKAQTADPNAMQLEIVHYGKVHGGGGPERLAMQQQQTVFGTTVAWPAIILGPPKPTDSSAISHSEHLNEFRWTHVLFKALMKHATDAMKASRVHDFLASLNALQYERQSPLNPLQATQIDGLNHVQRSRMGWVDDAGSSDWSDMLIFYCRRCLKRVISPRKMAEFLNEVQLKDDQRLTQLENLERETELRAFEKELFVQKLLRNVPFKDSDGLCWMYALVVGICVE
ncbi:hypothetical protein Tco_0092567, partial [Tanacetum coccineum]